MAGRIDEEALKAVEEEIAAADDTEVGEEIGLEVEEDESDDLGDEEADDESDEESGEDELAPADDKDDKGKDDGADKGGKKPDPVEPQEEPLPEDNGSTLAEFSAPSSLKELQEKEQAIEAKLDALDKKLADGDLSQEQFNRESRKLNRELTEVVGDRKADEARAKDADARFAREWERAQKGFFKDNPSFAKDKSPALYNALDAQVRALSADPEKAGLTLRQLLEQAKRDLRKAFGLQDEKPAAKVPDQKQKAKAQEQGKKKAAALPPSLDDLPSAGDSQESEFAFMDKMHGSAKTKAFNKMTAEQQKRYLEGG